MKAHDVRRLTCCPLCGNIGDSRQMLRVTWPAENETSFYHGSCYLKEYGLAALLGLPEESTGRLSLADIGLEAMKALLARHTTTPDTAK